MAPPSPDMSGPLSEPFRDDGHEPSHGKPREGAPDANPGDLFAELRSFARHEELDLRAAVVMFCNNAADAYHGLTPDELDECREVKKVRDYLRHFGTGGIEHLNERFHSARRIIRDESDTYVGDPETVEQLVTFFDSHLLGEVALCVMSEVIMGQVRLMNADIQENLISAFLDGIQERIAELDSLGEVAKGPSADDKQRTASLLGDQVESGRRTLGAALKGHLLLKMRVDSLLEETTNIFFTDFCSCCNIDDEYIASMRKNFEEVFPRSLEDALVNSYINRYRQIVQTLVGIGALQKGEKIRPIA